MARLLLAVFVLVGLVSTPPALAGAVIPDTESLPWTDPAHNSPLEQFASSVASEIAGRSVRVYCNGQTDWDALGQPSWVWGYVAQPRYWHPATRTFAESSTHMQLAPIACEHLWRFAKVAVKPTTCSAERIEPYTVRVKKPYRTYRKVRIRRGGQWKVVKRPVQKFRYVVQERRRETSLAPVPCYKPLVAPDVTVGVPDADYPAYVFALWTLAHESIHLADFVSGASVDRAQQEVEARADCYALQRLAEVAVRLGGEQAGAKQLALFVWEMIYPRRTELVSPNGDHYWSSECRPGGALDLNPATPDWPTG